MNRIFIARELLHIAKVLSKDLTNAEKAKIVKKVDAVKTLANNIQSLRNSVSRDLESDNEKEKLTALVIAIMDKTAERVGNEESADNDHVGVTGLKKKHVKTEGSKVTLTYVGKSSVKHCKEFSNETIAKILKECVNRAKTGEDFVMVTSDGFKIKADRINRYLEKFDITAKDIRGYSANSMIVKSLNSSDISKEESERKKKFNEVAKSVAEKVGHGAATLKTHYLLPNLEEEYVKKGKIIDLKDASFND